MSVTRSMCLSISLSLLAAACSSGQQSSQAGGVGGGATTTKAGSTSSTGSTTSSGGGNTSSSSTSSTTTSTGTTTTTTTTTVSMCMGPGGCMAPVCPPNLLHLEPAPSGPGLVLTWQEMGPCDTVEVEDEYGLIPYPSQQTPAGQPQYSVPGTMMSITDTTATGTNMYTFHARCVTGGVNSCWSNELANNGHVTDAGADGG